MSKLLILDLDGTIRRTKSGEKFINTPEDQELIPEADKSIRKYAKEGWLIVGCSNQGGVEHGFKSMKNCIKEQQITLQICPHLNQIFIAPSNNQCIAIYNDYGYQYSHWKLENGWAINLNNFDEKWESSGFRKPNTGMIEAIRLIYKDYRELLFIGDMESDRLCAEAAGIEFIQAQDWWG